VGKDQFGDSDKSRRITKEQIDRAKQSPADAPKKDDSKTDDKK
jgi:hypothetical protein